MKKIFKKVIIGVLVGLFVVLTGWKLFSSSSDISSTIEDRRANLTAYHMESTMDIEVNEETRSYYVIQDYCLKNDIFRLISIRKHHYDT